MKSYIIIGPKKTGSTTLYNSLLSSYRGPLKVLPKEQAPILKLKMHSLSKLLKGGVIDVSPEYFSSYRALIRLRVLEERYGVKFKVVILERSPKERLSSHVSYMFREGIISKELNEEEVEIIAAQAQDRHFKSLWEDAFNTIFINISEKHALQKFFFDELSACFKGVDAANVGGKSATFFKRAILRPAAKMFRKIGAARIVERTGSIDWIRRAVSRTETPTERETLVEIINVMQSFASNDRK